MPAFEIFFLGVKRARVGVHRCATSYRFLFVPCKYKMHNKKSRKNTLYLVWQKQPEKQSKAGNIKYVFTIIE